MTNINRDKCPLLQKLLLDGDCVRIGVISKKYNEPERKSCAVSYIAVKRIGPERVSPEKMEKYVRENRLVITVLNPGESTPIFLRNGNNCYSEAVDFIRFVDKNSSSDAATVEAELIKVIVEELTDEEYHQFCTYCLTTASDFSKNSKGEKKTMAADSSSAYIHSQDLASLKKEQFVRSILIQMAEIVNRHFEIIHEGREDETEQRKAAEKADQRRRDEIHYEETQRRNRKEQEKVSVEKSSFKHHASHHEEKRNNVRQENMGLPVAEHIA